MEQWEPDADADADDAMDAFLEKFQNEPYSGGFHEDQWEEVGGPGPHTCVVCVCVSGVGVVATPGAPGHGDASLIPGPGAASG